MNIPFTFEEISTFLLAEHTEPSTKPNGDATTIMHARRKFVIQPSDLPAEVWDDIVATGEATFQWDDVKGYIRKRNTNSKARGRKMNNGDLP